MGEIGLVEGRGRRWEAVYQEVILEHYRRPRNRGLPPAPTHSAHVENPLCGDGIEVALLVKGGVIEEIGFSGQLCSIGVASASLMTEFVKGREAAMVLDRAATLASLVSEGANGPAGAELAELAPLIAVRKYPARIQCVLLAWKALGKAFPGGKVS